MAQAATITGNTAGTARATMEIEMSENTTTTTTAATEGIAIGRSGQISRRAAFAGKRFGVDVKRVGGKAYSLGVVSRAFATEAAATAFAEAINTGKGSEVGGAWYATASDAIVVPVWDVPGKDQPNPWDTPAGKRALAQARKAQA